MKGLLHSKKFKANLYKWLFMYVGVMGLFTAVVTYSKYVSSVLSGADDARPAKFNVTILNEIADLECAKNADNVALDECYVGKFSPLTPMMYAFSVDTSELEVNTDFAVTFTVHEDFKVEKLEDITNPQDIKEINLTDEDLHGNQSISLFTPKEAIAASTGTKRIYRITVKYNGALINEDTNETIIFTDPFEVVKVGYSAYQQIDYRG